MRQIAYIVSEDLVRVSSRLPSNKHRSIVVHSLAKSFGFLSGEYSSSLRIVRPSCATRTNLLSYHDQEYVDYVLGLTDSLESDNSLSETMGLEGDCPPFPGLPHYVRLVAGASLTCASLLKEGHADIAMNWDGGRHHAQKSHAAGFCYVADCVLAILALKRSPKSRIMYLDFDLHYSDAVSQAFAGSTSGRVLTMSIHHSAPGFFPASPLSSLSDPHTCDPYTLSIPLKPGASDKTFRRIWTCVESVKSAFCPDYLLVQCGVDGLAGDPCATWNWSLGSSEGSFGWCISQALNWECKTILLGGGGYHSANAARAWSYATSLALGLPLPLDTDVPDHDHFPSYGPSFTLDVPAGNMPDENTDQYLDDVEQVYIQIADRLRLG